LEEGGGRMAESQLSDLRNMRVLLEEARLRAQDLACPSAGATGSRSRAGIGRGGSSDRGATYFVAL